MRIHATLPDVLALELDRPGRSRRRSAVIRELIERGLEDKRRWADIEAALGAVLASGHEWGENPAKWIRHQRQGDNRRLH